MMSYKNKSGIRQCGSPLLCSILCVVFLAAPVRAADSDEDIDAAVQFYLSREDSHFCKVSNNKSFSVGVQSPTEINAPRGRTLSGRQWFCADRNEV